MRQYLFGTASVLALVLSGCATVGNAPPAAPPGVVKLTVLHTNDHHGRFWKNNDGEYGLAARKTLIDQVRKEVAAQGGHTCCWTGVM